MKQKNNKKLHVLIGVILVLIVVAGTIVWLRQPFSRSLKCQAGEIGLTKCVGKKEVVYKCIPDPDECRLRVCDGRACERGRECILQPVTDCKHPGREQYLLRCVPEAVLEEGPKTTNTVEYQDKEYIRTEGTLAILPISEEREIMEIEGGELVYLIDEGTPDEKVLSLKPENIGKEGQNVYILWEEEEKFRYNEDVKEIKERILKANYCNEDSECAVVNFGCPFDCWSLVNQEEVEYLKRRVERLERYEFQCEQKCSPFSGTVRCIDNLCQ